MAAWDCYMHPCVAEAVLPCWNNRRMIQRQVSASIIRISTTRRVSVMVE